ncbi:hypothetical protein BLNAU_18955 [Blattamonas nauphoetae]|uniref:Uncharacterized protein n=1 Tax=Blattamonas nauphoetae TaxID=2049346 RepID=A0ABQ9X3D2_9EUKA|nr:hypothetical protein BLNAU_18955 [Blattamonas nauphoetae]
MLNRIAILNTLLVWEGHFRLWMRAGLTKLKEILISHSAPQVKASPSGITLVKEAYPFDNALQDRAARFLMSLEHEYANKRGAMKLATDLVPSSSGSFSGFFENIITILSSPHSPVISTALSLLHKTTRYLSQEIRYQLVESDLITKVFATVRPHKLPIWGNEAIHNCLIWIVTESIHLAYPFYLRDVGVTPTVDTWTHREIVFQKVVVPSSQFLKYLVSNRHILNEDLHLNRRLLNDINFSLKEWKDQGPELVQSAKRMIQALFWEGFEDTLEQMLRHDQSGYIGSFLVEDGLKLSRFLGANAS